MVRKASHKSVTGWGVVMLAFYPILLAFSTQVWHFYSVSVIGGLAFSLVSGASINYILENTPENDRPAHLAWYNIILNFSVLAGSLVGPAIADQIGLSAALIIAGILRGLAGIAILKWG
ncbi:MAG: MFS transporter [Chloroflexi bacterium]|nr:MAG: MFS transporter [Chloroflexota bacterium]